MQEKREFEGKDLAEALQAAAATLGIEEPELDYEIIEQGRKGLFGLGAKNVHIRVMTPVEQMTDRAILRDGGGSESPERPEPRERSAPPEAREARRSRPTNRSPRSGERNKSRRKAAPRDDGARDSRGTQGKQRTQGTQGTQGTAEEIPVSPEMQDLENQVRQMFELMGMSLEVRVRPGENGASLDLKGPDHKLLIQKDAELLAAMQFLLNRMARRAWPSLGRVQLTCDGRTRRRDEDLVELTREVAQQVSRTGQPKRLHSMNAYERRLVHLTVREFDGVGSRSEGSGYLKKVKVYRSQGSSSQARQPES